MTATPGRNEPCPCGSGKKFKKCHGGPDAARELRIDQLAMEAQRRAAVHRLQVRRQQGLGRPIISSEIDGRRFVVVGKQRVLGKWPTFQDFLHAYVVHLLGVEWFDAERAKPAGERHPVAEWYESLRQSMERHPPGAGPMLMPGSAVAFITLAYDLYTIEHNYQHAKPAGLLDDLLGRLRKRDQFAGVRYEFRTAAWMLRAGFHLEWEDERDRRQTHCEFTATWPATGAMFGVECKARNQVAGSGVSGINGLLGEALEKQTPHPRIVFVEVNTPTEKYEAGSPHDWRTAAVHRMRKFEADPRAASLPPAIVFVTNYPDQHHLGEPVPDSGVIVEGFKTGSDYRNYETTTISRKLDQRQRYVEVEALIESMKEHKDVPVTFDGSLPGLREDRLLIGDRVELPDGKAGVVEDATVLEPARKAYFAVALDDGGRILWPVALSDIEFETWRRFPETFFGAVRDRPGNVDDPMEFFDRLFGAFADTPKERLLEWMAPEEGPNRYFLANMSQQDLARLYVEGMVNSTLDRAGPLPVPVHVQRMRPVPKARGNK